MEHNTRHYIPLPLIDTEACINTYRDMVRGWESRVDLANKRKEEAREKKQARKGPKRITGTNICICNQRTSCSYMTLELSDICAVLQEKWSWPVCWRPMPRRTCKTMVQLARPPRASYSLYTAYVYMCVLSSCLYIPCLIVPPPLSAEAWLRKEDGPGKEVCMQHFR